MNRHEVLLLQQVNGYPALTITLPTHRTTPENRQDPIRLRNLVDQARNHLLEESNLREITPLLEHLESLVANIDFQFTLDGLALFINSDFAHSVKLPFTLKERVVISDTFLTRDLVYAMNRSLNYWVLSLSEKPTRLYEGTRETLIEIQEEGFPLIHTGPGGEQSLPGGFGIKKSAYRDEKHRQFFRQVDSALRPFLLDDPRPLIVAGVDRYLAFFTEVSDHTRTVAATLTGNFDKTSPHDLGKMVWPLAQTYFTEKRQQALSELEEAIGKREFVSTIGEVWRFAHQGRGRLLLVEEDFHFPFELDENGKQVETAHALTTSEVGYDAVDDLIEMVIAKQGQVVFVEKGQLEAHQQIALILRY